MAPLYSNELKLYSSVKEVPVDWLWYPYIPFGKITLLQGDPGGGKSTLIMSIIAAISNGGQLPDGTRLKKPLHVIYQCSEDGAADTIKPRLVKAGANCQNVAFFDEELDPLTLNDETFRRAVADFNAKLLVIDPFQAYLGDADISNVASLRKILRKLGIWASLYDCAIVLIGHLNKRQNAKELYRGLGSIDIIAAARSVIQVCKDEENPDIRTMSHVKSSLAPIGKDRRFYIDANHGVRWLDSDNPVVPLEADSSQPDNEMITKQEQACVILKDMLSEGPRRAVDIRERFAAEGISERTMMHMKKTIGIHSARKGGIWYWQMFKNADDSQGGKDNEQ